MMILQQILETYKSILPLCNCILFMLCNDQNKMMILDSKSRQLGCIVDNNVLCRGSMSSVVHNWIVFNRASLEFFSVDDSNNNDHDPSFLIRAKELLASHNFSHH